MSANGNGRVDVSLFGISDAELLAIVDDCADENGWATTLTIRWQLGVHDDEKRSGVGTRLAWLKRYGWLEHGEREKVQTDDERGWRWSRSWRLTAMGHALLDNPDLSKSIENALAKLNPAQRLALTRELGEFGSGSAPELRTALRRQWQRSLGMRR